MEHMARDIRMATDVNIDEDAGGTFQQVTYKDRNGTTVSYTHGAVDRVLVRNDSPVARYVASFEVRWVDNDNESHPTDVLEISITTEHQGQSHDLRVSIKLRNPD